MWDINQRSIRIRNAQYTFSSGASGRAWKKRGACDLQKQLLCTKHRERHLLCNQNVETRIFGECSGIVEMCGRRGGLGLVRRVRRTGRTETARHSGGRMKRKFGLRYTMNKIAVITVRAVVFPATHTRQTHILLSHIPARG